MPTFVFNLNKWQEFSPTRDISKIHLWIKYLSCMDGKSLYLEGCPYYCYKVQISIEFSIHRPTCSLTNNFLQTDLNKTNLHIETITQVVASIKTNATANPTITPIKSGDCKISWIQSFRSPHHLTEVFVSSKGLMLPEMSEFDVSGTESTTKVPLLDTIPVVVTLLPAIVILPVELMFKHSRVSLNRLVAKAQCAVLSIISN